MIYDTPPKPFYVFESGSDDFTGFGTLEEAMEEAKSRCAEKELATPIYVFETKASFNTEPEPDTDTDTDAIALALIPRAVRDGRRRPTPEELEKMPPNWEEIWRRYWNRHLPGGRLFWPM